MQPYVIPKRPGKAILYLLTIMVLCVKDSYGYGKCHGPCFGPVSKVKIFNELSNGLVHIEGNTVVANYTPDGTIYKISKGASFYLYDANAGKFICWSNKKNNKKTTLVARKFKSPQSLRLCEFYEFVSTNHRQSHVHLVSSFSKDVKMKFNRNGRYSMKCNHPKSRHQRSKRCATAAEFLIDVVANNNDDPCGCPEVRDHFCHPDFRKLTEFHEICKSSGPRSNETYQT